MGCCRVRMLGGCVDAQFAAQNLTPKRGLRQHAVHGLLDDTLRMTGEHRRKRRELLVPHVAGVREVLLLFGLAAGDLHLRRVDDDDVVTGIHVRGEDRLVLAANDLRDFSSETAEHHAVRVHDEPTLLDIARRGGKSLHCSTNKSGSRASPVRHATRVSAAPKGIFDRPLS